MAFPFAAIGAGLGQGTQAIMQQMQQMAQQRMQAAALQQYQQQLATQRLAGEALMAGGVPGLGGGSGINSLPGAQMPAGPMTGAANGGIGLPGTMPVPQVPQMQPGPIGGSPLGGGPTPVVPAASPQTPRDTGVFPLEDDMGNAQQRADELGVPALTYDIAREGPPPPEQPAPERAAAAPADTAAPAQDFGGGGTQAANPNEMPLYLSMFNRVDPQAIAKRIMEIKPGADPATVMGAVEKLYKLSSGDWHQQATAASVMKALLGNQTRTDIANANRPLAERKVAAIEGNLGEREKSRLERGRHNLEAEGQGRERIGIARERLSEQNFQKALANAKGQEKAQLSEMHRQLGNMDRRIAEIQGLGYPNGKDKQEFDALVRARAELAVREAAAAEPLLKREAAPIPLQ